ncbi:hypothetical protein ASF60_21045 [Methylobacterium sp. Leaf113]|uniref:Ig-like domain-containing protein n=1 Tax=Methylobacterium sp. Leaf113 TaxID=1736259 RepID=UPI0006F5BC9A|nr:Ig-like domain-containing protein [Methylobacterium sp. Leaf113]KQP87309.1 hypothetical protein ASF60_21045 [Methylobacterium sp. Leaf113]
MNAVTDQQLHSTFETLANAPPSAQIDFLSLDPFATVIEIPVSQLLSNDTDPDVGDVIRLVSVDGGESGTAELVSDASGQRVVFTLPKDWSSLLDGPAGPDSFNAASFAYTIEDSAGATSTTGAVIFPTYFYLTDQDFTLAEDASVVIFEGDLRGIIVEGPQHGHLETVSLGEYNTRFTYVPDRDYFGADSVEFDLFDRGFDFTQPRARFDFNVTPVDEASYFRGTTAADVIDQSSATSRVLIAGLEGNDTLRGGAGSDALNGGAGNDIITGAAGNDSITGGLGADRMGGGAGNDTFHIARGDLAVTGATDLIVDFQRAGQAGGDVIRFTGFAAGSTLELVGTSGNARVYEVHDTGGVTEGQLLISAGGALGQVLTTNDYAFA